MLNIACLSAFSLIVSHSWAMHLHQDFTCCSLNYFFFYSFYLEQWCRTEGCGQLSVDEADF